MSKSENHRQKKNMKKVMEILMKCTKKLQNTIKYTQNQGQTGTIQRLKTTNCLGFEKTLQILIFFLQCSTILVKRKSL